jgi:bla regulator protein BlaR1
MTIDLTIIGKATAVLAVALALARLLRRRRASIRALLLSAALGIVLLLPAAALLLPPRPVHLPYAGTVSAAFARFEPTSIAPIATAAPARPAGPRLPSINVLLRGLWLLGMTVVLWRLAVPLRRLRAIRHGGLAWPEAGALVRTLTGPRWRRPVDVFLHDGLSGPMTCGVRRPAIGLPIDAPEWSETMLRHALTHELEHIRRGDWLTHILAWIVCAMYWFHPLVWLTASRLRLEAERACDDAVLRDADRTTYAEQLVRLARRLAKRDAVAALSMAGPSDLATRVRAVLDAGQARGPAGVRSALCGVAVVVAVALTISPLRAAPASPQQAPFTIDPALVFEVVSVKPNQPGELARGFGFTPATGRVRLTNQTLRRIVSTAYAQPFGLFVPDERLTGGPDWFNTERFTIEGRAGRAASAEDLGAMLRAVLAQRFNLKIRVETRQESIHALIRTEPGSLGPELKPAAVDCQGRCGIGGGSGKLLLTSAPLYLLTLSLSEVVGTPVVDRTGLTGSFDGTLAWTPSAVEHDPFGEPGVAPPVPAFGPSVFTALEDQFGLKLVSERGPVEYFVVEHAERPIPNDAPELDAR